MPIQECNKIEIIVYKIIIILEKIREWKLLEERELLNGNLLECNHKYSYYQVELLDLLINYYKIHKED